MQRGLFVVCNASQIYSAVEILQNFVAFSGYLNEMTEIFNNLEIFGLIEEKKLTFTRSTKYLGFFYHF